MMVEQSWGYLMLMLMPSSGSDWELEPIQKAHGAQWIDPETEKCPLCIRRQPDDRGLFDDRWDEISSPVLMAAREGIELSPSVESLGFVHQASVAPRMVTFIAACWGFLDEMDGSTSWTMPHVQVEQIFLVLPRQSRFRLKKTEWRIWNQSWREQVGYQPHEVMGALANRYRVRINARSFEQVAQGRMT